MVSRMVRLAMVASVVSVLVSGCSSYQPSFGGGKTVFDTVDETFCEQYTKLDNEVHRHIYRHAGESFVMYQKTRTVPDDLLERSRLKQYKDELTNREEDLQELLESTAVVPLKDVVLQNSVGKLNSELNAAKDSLHFGEGAARAGFDRVTAVSGFFEAGSDVYRVYNRESAVVFERCVNDVKRGERRVTALNFG